MLTIEEILERNEKISKMLNLVHQIRCDRIDWNITMYVVEFIENLVFNNDVCTNKKPIVDIKQNSCYIYINADLEKSGTPKGGKYYYWCTGNLPIFGTDKKEAVFIAISNFAEEYNNKRI